MFTLTTRDGVVITVSRYSDPEDAMIALRENYGLGYDDVPDSDLIDVIERSQGVVASINYDLG